MYFIRMFRFDAKVPITRTSFRGQEFKSQGHDSDVNKTIFPRPRPIPHIYTMSQRIPKHSFFDNFGKHGPILITLSLLHS